MGLVFVCSMVLVRLLAAQHILDLTRTEPSDTRRRGEGPLEVRERVKSYSSTGTIRPLPLQIRLVDLDRRDYLIGSRIVSDVQIMNVGQEAMVLPWARCTEDVERDDAIAAFLSLVVEGRDRQERTLAGVILTGSADRPWTLRTLEPGESALIRAPGWLQLGSAEAMQSFTVEGETREFAIQFAYESPGISWQRMKSSGMLASIRVQPPKVR